MNLIKDKIKQAIGILGELDIDLWLVFLRESDMMADPVMPLVIGRSVVWQSAFFFHRSGDTAALVGNFDMADFEKSGHFSRVIPYVQDCGTEIRRMVKKYKPARIALDFSTDNCAADGLTHGMYLLLNEYLKDTPYIDRFVSSENLISLLRGRKTAEEITRLGKAAKAANDIWPEIISRVRPGLTEKAIGAMIDQAIKDRGHVNSFETIVNAGSKTSPGHGHPTDAVLEKGDLLHVDFGLRYDGYCSDIQRLAYIRKEAENTAPPELTAAFAMVRKIITETSKLYTPGRKGYRIDAVARKMLKENGYPEYQHALGHQIGQSVHDGAAIVGPRWKRYGRTAEIPLEKNNAFTVELGIDVDNIGYAGLEEDLIVTEKGGKFLCPPQEELNVI